MSNIGTKFILANRFTFDPNNNSLIEFENESESIRLGSNESRILLFLSENSNTVVTRNELHDFVWREQGFEVDDSSLTQAISTLRKLLRDSTKSPQFVKTVPKRGYQLICSVEKTNPILSGDDDIELSQIRSVESEVYLIKNPEPEINIDHNVEREIDVQNSEPYAAENKQIISEHKSKPRLIKFVVFLAILLPIFALTFGKSNDSQFRTIATFDNVIIKTPISHPQLVDWIPAIEQCVIKYNLTHKGTTAPVEVIATGGQNHQLVLNYIHRIEHSDENVTLRLFAEQSDFSHICR